MLAFRERAREVEFQQAEVAALEKSLAAGPSATSRAVESLCAKAHAHIYTARGACTQARGLRSASLICTLHLGAKQVEPNTQKTRCHRRRLGGPLHGFAWVAWVEWAHGMRGLHGLS